MHSYTLANPSVEILEELSFEPTCSFHYVDQDCECGNSAQWFLLAKCGCSELFCETHHEYITQYTLPVSCDVCGITWPSYYDGLIREERIK